MEHPVLHAYFCILDLIFPQFVDISERNQMQIFDLLTPFITF